MRFPSLPVVDNVLLRDCYTTYCSLRGPAAVEGVLGEDAGEVRDLQPGQPLRASGSAARLLSYNKTGGLGGCLEPNLAQLLHQVTDVLALLALLLVIMFHPPAWLGIIFKKIKSIL